MLGLERNFEFCGVYRVIADKNIRDGLFQYIIEKELTNTKDFKEIIKIIGIELSWRAMGSLDVEDNKKIIEGLVA